MAQPIERVLCLAFCTGGYPPFSTTNLVPLEPMASEFVAENLVNVEAEYFPAPSHLPRSLRIGVKGVMGVTGNQQPELLQPAGPLHDGFVAFDFTSTSETNIEGMMIPQRWVASYYGLDSLGEAAQRYKTAEYAAQVRGINVPPCPISKPLLPSTASIIDSRYLDTSGRVYRYFESNGVWVASSEWDAEEVVATKPQIPIHKRAAR